MKKGLACLAYSLLENEKNKNFFLIFPFLMSSLMLYIQLTECDMYNHK